MAGRSSRSCAVAGGCLALLEKVSLLVCHILLGVTTLAAVRDVAGEVYSVNTKASWERWTIPKGVVTVGDNGQVRLVEIRRPINTSLDAPQFLSYSEEQKRKVPGGVTTGSSPQTVGNLIDGRAETYWSPDPQDPLEQWVVTVDLGRMVAATMVRLVFADAAGLQPLEQFAVYVSEGAKVYPKSDFVQYRLIGRTTLPNRLRVVEYPLAYRELADTTGTGRPVDVSLGFSQVQYVRVVPTARTSKAALAEIEVEALGDNLALGTFERFGSIDVHMAEQNGPKIIDGNGGTSWDFQAVSDIDWDKGPIVGPLKRPAGSWFEWDLGAAFWVEQIITFFGREGKYGLRGRADRPEGYIIQTSDGSPRAGGAVDGPGGRFTYVPLVDVWNRDLPYRYQFSHPVGPPRRVRWIFWRHAHGSGLWGRSEFSGSLFEMQAYGSGFPAEVTLMSSLTDTELINATQGKNVTGVAWDAEVPQGARLEIQSRTGNGLIVEKRFFNKDMKEVLEKDYRRLPASLRGDSLVTTTPGLDWSDWSDVYAESGDVFLSPSPRQYLQLRIKLISERSDAAPTVRSLSLQFTDPFVKEAKGKLWPNEAQINTSTRYAFGIRPMVEAGNPGFDRILIRSSAVFEREGLLVEVNNTPVAPAAAAPEGNSLMMQLSRVLRSDSIVVRLTATVIKSATLFEAFVGNSSLPGVWQSVEPLRMGATTVFSPSVWERKELLGSLRVEPPVVTPNGDGVNDETVISFLLLKVEEREPRVVVRDLRGRMVRELVRSTGAGYRYVWDGQAASGTLVAPGVYVCLISVDADAGKTAVCRTVGVVY